MPALLEDDKSPNKWSIEVSNISASLAMNRVPYPVYTDEKLFSREMATIFRSGWVNVGLSSELPTVESYRTTSMGSDQVIVSRHEDGVTVCRNVCSHKGAVVGREERGCARYLTCIYHQWKFRNSGELSAVPKVGSMPKNGFQKEGLGLEAAPRVAEHGGIIFASWNPDAPPIEQALAEAADELGEITQGEPHDLIGRQRYILNANWKIYLENAKDGYHAGLLHKLLPALGYYTDTRAIVLPNGHGMLRWPTSADLRTKSQSHGRGVSLQDYSVLETTREGWNRVLTIFPNTLVSHQADMILVRQIVPLAVNKTLIIQNGLVPSSSTLEFRERSARQMANYQGSSGWVGHDDIVAMNAQQVGMESYQGGETYVALGADTYCRDNSGESEALIRSFYDHWLRTMGE